MERGGTSHAGCKLKDTPAQRATWALLGPPLTDEPVSVVAGRRGEEEPAVGLRVPDHGPAGALGAEGHGTELTWSYNLQAT